jgi:hypothetical protein
MAAASSYTSVTIAVRGKSVGKQSRGAAAKLQKSDTAVAQDQLRKNIHAVLGNFQKRDLFRWLPDPSQTKRARGRSGRRVI